MELSTENRLRLKRTNLESSQTKVTEFDTKPLLDNNKMDKNVAIQGYTNGSFEAESDSLLDFKSPKSKIAKPKLNEVTKSNSTKQKKRTSTKFKCLINNQKQVKLKHHSEKSKNAQESQLSIESSFFKSKNSHDNGTAATDVKVALVCPLCFKTFKDSDSQALHMKICAYRNNISTKKLLDVIELQKRQEDERKSLGLLAAPVVQEKRKQVPRKINVNDESDLQLALALSRSLQEAEELDEISEVEGLTKIPNLFVSEVSDLPCKRKLVEFRFPNNKPAAPVRNRKRKHNRITLLQTRTQDERNRILTERISEILMENEPITQKQEEQVQEIREEIVLKSVLLGQLCYKEDKLWDKAKLTPNQKCFYVTNLSDHIIPKEVVEIQEEENHVNFNLCEKEGCSDEKVLYEIPRTELCLTNEDCEMCEEKTFVNTVVTNWWNALNNSSASDVVILVDNDKHIWAHKLVFYVQCPNILLDVMPNDIAQFNAAKEKICWLDISYDVALAFLEFIYCGIIKNYLNILENSASLSLLQNLARKYKVKELFTYLKRKEIKMKQTMVQIHNAKGIEHENSLVIEGKDNLELTRKSSENLIYSNQEEFKLDEYENSDEKLLESIVNKSGFCETELKIVSLSRSNVQSPTFGKYYTQELKETASVELSPEVKDYDTTNMSSMRYSTISPDMFDDTIFSDKRKATVRIAGIEEMRKSTNLNILDSNNEITIDSFTDRVSVNEGDAAGSPQTMNDTSSKSNEECMNSLSNKSQSSQLKRMNAKESDIVSVKSNLSLFIEQFQRDNAKSDLDSDSEGSLLLKCPKLNRNPFNLKKHDNSDRDSVSYENNTIKETAEKEKDVWKKLDSSVRNSKLGKNASHEENDTATCSSPESIENLRLSLVNNIENNTESNPINRSIDSPEKILQNILTPLTSKSMLKEDTSITDLEETPVKKISFASECEDQDSIILDVDLDENEVSMYARYKKNNANNSIMKYRDFVKKYVLKKSEDDEPEKENSTDNEDVIVLSDTDTSSDFTNVLVEKRVNRTEEIEFMYNVEPKQTAQESSRDINDENIVDGKDIKEMYHSVRSLSPVINSRNTSEIRRSKKSMKMRYSKSENDINVTALKNKARMPSLEQETDKFDPAGSPVLISSSPELDFDALNAETCRRNSATNGAPNFDEFSDISHLLENDIYLANVHINNDNYGNGNCSLSAVVKEVNQLTDISNQNNGTKELKSRENSTGAKESVRKLQRKSVSETHLTVNAININDDVSEPWLQCKCGNKKTIRTVTSPIIVRDNVTPPPTYEAMGTPELHAELNKYGLKMQKRNRAVKLLTYIYNELHPVISTAPKTLESEFAITSSEDEEPPMKKLHYHENNVNDDKYDLPLSQDSILSMESPTNIINEERQIDDPEPINVIDGTSDLKDVFSKLISTRKELHNKILSYEPLCLDSLHSMLKAEDCKCKMNTLMDFLDEQCITFYCRDVKQKKDKKKVI